MNNPSPNATNTIDPSKGVADVLQIAQVMHALTTAALAPENIDGAHFAFIPPGYTHKDITEAVEKAQPTPDRKRGMVVVKDVASLMAYCADQAADADGYLYADPDARRITAIFNDHRTAPGWRDHRAEFKAEYTPEFENWLRNNKQPKDQGAFAEFIEDNFADLAGDDAQTLLDVATTIQAKTNINFGSAKRLQNGQVQLTYTEDIDARAGASGALEIPKEFTLGLRIFKNGAGYKLRARLKYRLASGSVKFWYELDRPERSIEDAFAGYVETLREKSGYQVLIGTP
jgi:uncharacterized protein YfdQ (DUF2303 family)